MFFVEPTDQGGLRFQTLRVAVAAHELGRDLPVPSEALMPTDRADRPDTEAFGRLTPRCTRFNRGDYTLAQINRQG
ncbi:hypothetical protein GCM10025880_08270 [Methylorubrum aminovorans]|nr:hypothetical protein GCM10025880_08270 [Methylorubrum aminovorans]